MSDDRSATEEPYGGHGQALMDADVELDDACDRASVRLGRKEPGIAPGQFTVFYNGKVCLGGARIVG